MGKEKGKILQWHPAFFAGLQIELAEDAQYLHFENEHLLSSKPMQVDVLIIKKEPERRIKKNIGRIFRGHNILEYKSPEDSLGIDDFYKVYGYTCFYKSDTKRADEIRAEELSISFVCCRYPRELIRRLRQAQQRVIVQREPGIYDISDALFPIQLIVTGHLTPEENLWLRSLTNDLKNEEEARKLLLAYQEHQPEKLYRAVMD
ncbi:MAG: 3-isopropylmalate dehydrogenase, partial [Lachnospiraceae bacterium]|nr:3-isopropylmalate dehydrogenase [Lachnospiraceae bacterium]